MVFFCKKSRLVSRYVIAGREKIILISLNTDSANTEDSYWDIQILETKITRLILSLAVW